MDTETIVYGYYHTHASACFFGIAIPILYYLFSLYNSTHNSYMYVHTCTYMCNMDTGVWESSHPQSFICCTPWKHEAHVHVLVTNIMHGWLESIQVA